jgi:hypothetical protein
MVATRICRKKKSFFEVELGMTSVALYRLIQRICREEEVSEVWSKIISCCTMVDARIL